jgi:PKD repeat protein
MTTSHGSITVNEGETATNSGTATDPDADTLTLSASVGTVLNSGDGTWSWSFSTSDGPDESQMVTVTADDGNGGLAQITFDLAVENVAPSIDAIVAPGDPININDQPVGVEVWFGDPGTADTHDVSWDWGDEASDTQQGVTSPATQNHTYATAGVYRVTVTVTDDDGGTDSEVYEYIVIYNPDGGFVTGGGHIWSEAGWCQLDEVCAGAEGKANFGFVSKYKKGTSVPTGNTEFNFRAGNLNFHSDSYEWLVVNQGGTNAQYKGSGTLSGETGPDGGYKFMIWAKDLDPEGEDTLRIKIWYGDGEDEFIVYDNGFDQPIVGGNIKVHEG